MSLKPERLVFASSELSRNSAEVFTAAETHPVTISRRSGEPLVLMAEQHANNQAELVSFAARLIAATTDNRGTLVERMCVQFPWMLALSGPQREECSRELLVTARASFATGQLHIAAMALLAWQEAATNFAAGLVSYDTQ